MRNSVFLFFGSFTVESLGREARCSKLFPIKFYMRCDGPAGTKTLHTFARRRQSPRTALVMITKQFLCATNCHPLHVGCKLKVEIICVLGKSEFVLCSRSPLQHFNFTEKSLKCIRSWSRECAAIRRMHCFPNRIMVIFFRTHCEIATLALHSFEHC